MMIVADVCMLQEFASNNNNISFVNLAQKVETFGFGPLFLCCSNASNQSLFIPICGLNRDEYVVWLS